MKIREANIADVDGIAYVHVNSWKTTYKGLVPDDFLDKLSVDRRKKQWAQSIESSQVIFVAEDMDGKIVGFASGGACRESELSYDGELYAIYILKENQGNGIGKGLIKSIADQLSQKQHKSMMAWALEGNPAIQFYEKLGGKIFSSKEVTIGGEILQEVALGWDCIEELL